MSRVTALAVTFFAAVAAGWGAGKFMRPDRPAEPSPGAAADPWVAGLTDVEAVRRAWRGLEDDVESDEFAWRLKAALLWERWAVLDMASALEAPVTVKTSRKVPDALIDHGERPAGIPARRVFYVLAGQDMDRAVKEANARPYRTDAWRGIYEFLAENDPPKFFAGEVEMVPGASLSRFYAIAFRKWLDTDFPAARRWIEAEAGRRRVPGMNEYIGLDQMFYEKLLVTAPEEMAKLIQERKVLPGTDLRGLYPAIAVAVAKQSPALAASLIEENAPLREALVSADFPLALTVVEKFRNARGRAQFVSFAGDCDLQDFPAAAAWLEKELSKPGSQNTLEERFLEMSVDKIFMGWWQTQREEALAWLLRLPGKIPESILTGRFLSVILREISWEDQDRLLERLPRELAQHLAGDLLRAAGPRNPARRAALLSKTVPGATRDSALGEMARQYSTKDPAKAREMIAQMGDPSERGSRLATMIQLQMYTDPDFPDRVFGELTDAVEKDEVARSLAGRYDDPLFAWKWSKAIAHEGRRRSARDTLMQAWPLALRQEALRVLTEAGDDILPAQKEQYTKRFQ